MTWFEFRQRHFIRFSAVEKVAALSGGKLSGRGTAKERADMRCACKDSLPTARFGLQTSDPIQSNLHYAMIRHPRKLLPQEDTSRTDEANQFGTRPSLTGRVEPAKFLVTTHGPAALATEFAWTSVGAIRLTTLIPLISS